MTNSRGTGSTHRLRWPSKAHRDGPAGVLRGSDSLPGIQRPYSDISAEVHNPGLPTPVRSAYRVSHPLDGFLPPSFPATRTGATHGVHPSELFPSTEPYALRRLCPLAVSGIAYSCSENQKFTMPRGSRALLPAKIRTRHRPKPESGRCSPGIQSPLQSVPFVPRARLPGPFPRALFPLDLREVERPALQGLDEHSGRTPLTGWPTLLRFFTRTCPRILPTTVMLRTSELAGRSIDLAGGSLPRMANSPFTTLSKRSL
jgi:hypothetical protein